MTLQNALNYFESLVSGTSKISETRVYEEFIEIISGLEKRNLSESEILSIEKELDALDLKASVENNKKYFGKALRQFKKYLKDTFFLIPKGHYTNLGIGLGASFGILFGIVILSGLERSLGISLGIGFGMLFGLVIGQSMDAKAKKEGKVL